MRALRRTPYDGEILRLAIPALGALAADPLVSLIDTAFVGRLGAESLAALGVAVAVFGLTFAVATFLPYGATPLIAAATGAGDTDDAGRLGRGVLLLGAVTGVVAAIAIGLGARPAAELMGAGPDVIDQAVGYLQIRSLSIPAVLLVLAAHGIYRGHQDTRTPLVVSVGISVVNLALDPLFIFGFGWDLNGAAWATAIAQWLGAVAFVALLLGPHRRRLHMTDGSGWALRPLFRAGVALIVRTASLVATFSLATAIAARVGTAEVAAHQVAFQIWIFLALVLDALAIAGQARVGAYVGAGDASVARAVSDRLLGMGVIFGTALTVLLVAGWAWLPGWFTNDAAVVSAVGAIYAYVAFSQPLNALVFVWDGIGLGAGAFNYLAGSMVLSAGLSIGTLLLVLPLELGLRGVWFGLLVFVGARAIALGWWYWSGPLGRGRDLVSRAT